MAIEKTGVKLCKVTDQIINFEEITNSVRSDTFGAIVTFSGEVRNNDSGKIVKQLTYEIHPTAEKVLEQLLDDAIAENPEVNIAAVHRFGNIPIGESALIVSVASRHRADAFKVCNELVEKIKALIPIWKNQLFADGSSEWVNSA